jgi:hypothetical protein
MQLVERVNATKNEFHSNALVEEIYAPSLSSKTDKVNVQETNVLKLKRASNLSRILEANSDCV